MSPVRALCRPLFAAPADQPSSTARRAAVDRSLPNQDSWLLADVDERAHRRVRVDQASLGVRHLHAAEALRKPVRGPDIAVQSVTTVEIADPRNARIAVVADRK